MIRRARLLLLLLVGATAVTACGSVNAGSEAADQFTEWMAQTEHVEGFDLESNNALPWTGTLEAGVLVDPDATVEQIAEVARRATSFEARAATTFTIGYSTDDFTTRFPVLPEAADANLAMITLARHVDESTAATEFVVHDGSGLDEVDVVVTVPDDVLAVFDELAARIAAQDVGAGDLLLVQNVERTFSITADRGTGAARSRAAYEAVLAGYPVTGAHLTDTTLDLRVDAAETPAVVELAQRTAPSVTTTVQFGTVTKTADGDYAAAEALLAELTAAGPVLSSVLAPQQAVVTVAEPATVLAMFAAVGDGPLYGGVLLRVETADERFSVSSSAEPLSAHLPVVEELSASRWTTLVTAATVDANGVDVRTADLTAAQARHLGGVLARTPAGAEIEVRPGSSVGFRLVGAAQLTAESLETFGDPNGAEADLLAAFVAGWNASS